MKKILSAALALSVFASAGVASAQPRSYNGNDRDGRYDQRQDNRSDNRGDRRDHERFDAGRYNPPRGYQARHWGRGERLPSAYRGRGYEVDYRRYRLNAPPRGYHYVRVGNDVVLTAVATGVIASVIADLFR